MALPHSASRRRRTPTQRRSVVTVDAILTAADQLLGTRELDAFTTHDIAARAGVSIGTLYQYFPSKESVVSELMSRRHAQLYEALHARSMELRDAPISVVVSFVCQTVIDALLARPAVTKLFVESRDRIVGRAEVTARKELAVALVRAALETRPERAAVLDLDTACWIFVELLQNGVRTAALERPEALRDGRFTREYTALVCRYLGAPVLDPSSWAAARGSSEGSTHGASPSIRNT